MSMSYQLAQSNDLPRLSAFVNRAYRGDTARQGWTHEADLLDGTRVEASLLAEELARGVSLVMAYDSDELLGCYHFEMKEAHTAYVGMITVDPLKQGGGLGKQLLENAFARARTLGAQLIKLTVMSDRHELIAYYERRGFKRTGAQFTFEPSDTRYGLPKKDLVLLEMSRNL
jgi:ribosomal protein S18 acetylase RimI-like enzyme